MADTDPRDRRPSGIAVPIALPTRIARVRSRWDRAALAGAKPHVTVLYPFISAPDLTLDVRADLASIATGIRAFDVQFSAIGRFDDVVWIEPEPAAPFRALTDAVVTRWPAWPPYDGLFDEVIPHLTVVESETAPLDEVARAIEPALPFESRARSMELWVMDAEGRWRPRWRLPLGAHDRVGR